jgi:hypothetical protein
MCVAFVLDRRPVAGDRLLGWEWIHLVTFKRWNVRTSQPAAVIRHNHHAVRLPRSEHKSQQNQRRASRIRISQSDRLPALPQFAIRNPQFEIISPSPDQNDLYPNI